MALMNCPECGKQISDKALTCPDCGCPINATPAVSAPNIAEEVAKLLVLARRARSAQDSVNAKRCYDQILKKDPGNWEAIFYSVYFAAIECKVMHMVSAANSVASCMYSTFAAITDLTEAEERSDAIDNVVASALNIASFFLQNARRLYLEHPEFNDADSDRISRSVAAQGILAATDAALVSLLGDEQERIVAFRKNYLSFLNSNTVLFSEEIKRLERELAAVDSRFAERLRLQQQVESLTKEVEALNGEINAVTASQLPAGCFGKFFSICGVISLILGILLMSLGGGAWPIYVAIPELILGSILKVVEIRQNENEQNENNQKTAQLTAQRDQKLKELAAMREKLNSMNF